MLLPSLITLRHPPSHSPSPEDIFESSLGSVFVDDLQNQHGDDADTVIVYRPSNASFKPVELRAADVNGEEQRRKFAHYLWNAGVLVAELIAGREEDNGEGDGGVVESSEGGQRAWGEGWKRGEWWTEREEEARWNVRGQKVLELGAGEGDAN